MVEIKKSLSNIIKLRKHQPRLINRKKFIFSNGKPWLYFFYLTLGLIIMGLVGVVVALAWFSRDLPTPNRVVRRDGFATRIYDRNGALLYDLYKDAKRMPVVWEDLPEQLKNATVAVEDKDFYKHSGFDPLTPFRIIKNIFYFKKLTGGSTLTQQLVKNVLLTSDVSVQRKIKEFILAVQIEAKYKKSDILLMYLNEAPYGGPAWGVGTAAMQYFGKQVKDLDLTESVILAGLPQRPNAYSPFSKTPTAYISRSNHVLNRMVEDGYIDAEEAKETMEKVKNYKFYQNSTAINAPHFVFWVRDELAKKYGDAVVEAGGLKVTTTLDLELHNKIQQIVSEEVEKSEKLGISNGAVVVVDPTSGQVLAMVGSRGFYSDKTDGQFNVITQGLRQPGSSIKPVVYLTGLMKGMTASSMIVDAPVSFPISGSGQKEYTPQNYNGKYNGPMSLRNALGNSINTTAVKTLATVGLESVLKQAYLMGFSTLEPTSKNMTNLGLSLALGGGEVKMIDMARAYSSFANQGVRPDIVGILKVEDGSGRVLEEYRQLPGERVMSPQEAFIISDILSDNKAREMTFGSVNGLIVSGYQVAVKTGTTNDKRDNWAVGWTPNILALAWVGNNDNKPMVKVASGVSGATPIWRRVMLVALAGKSKVDFSIPEKIISQEVDLISGYNAHDGFPSRKEYLIDGTQPSIDDPIHLKLKVCKNSFGLAPPGDVAVNEYDSKEYIKLREEDPVSKDGKNRWQEGIEKWIETQPDKEKYNVPEDFCRSGGLMDIAVDGPIHESTVGNEVEVKLRVTSLKKVVEVRLWIDGVEKKVWTEKPFETKLTLPDGKHLLRAQATDRDGNKTEREAKFGVNVPWDWNPSPTGLSTATPTIIPTVTPTPVVITPTVVVIPSST